MNSTIRHGLILGAILAIIPYLLYGLGLEKNDTIQKVFGFVNPAIVGLVIYMGIKAYREKEGAGFISFGKGFSNGMVMALIAGAISAIATYIMYAIVSPGMITYIRMKQEADLVAKGMSDSEVEKMLDKMAMFSTPPMLSAFVFLGMIILGLVVSLICAGILKKEDPSAQIS